MTILPISVLLPFDLFLCWRNIICPFICIKSILIHMHLPRFARPARLHKGTPSDHNLYCLGVLSAGKGSEAAGPPGLHFPARKKLSRLKQPSREGHIQVLSERQPPAPHRNVGSVAGKAGLWHSNHFTSKPQSGSTVCSQGSQESSVGVAQSSRAHGHLL